MLNLSLYSVYARHPRRLLNQMVYVTAIQLNINFSALFSSYTLAGVLRTKAVEKCRNTYFILIQATDYINKQCPKQLRATTPFQNYISIKYGIVDSSGYQQWYSLFGS